MSGTSVCAVNSAERGTESVEAGVEAIVLRMGARAGGDVDIYILYFPDNQRRVRSWEV